MDLNICQNCKNFTLMPLRYKCLRDFYFSKYKCVQGYLLKETFFKHKYPKQCIHKNKGVRQEEVCSNCIYYQQELQRVKCKYVTRSSIFKPLFKNMLLPEKCIYHFEQEFFKLTNESENITNECQHKS